MLENENGDEEQQNQVSTGPIIFVIIISASVLGLIYLLIRKYRKEHKQ